MTERKKKDGRHRPMRSQIKFGGAPNSTNHGTRQLYDNFWLPISVIDMRF